ncbi:hypothetical protein MY3296_008707 [Beauveria thailandica]
MSSKPYQKNGHLAPYPQPSVDDWEEWEDASVAPSDNDEQVLVHHQPPPKPPSQYLRPPKNLSVRVSRYSTVKIKRLKSRHRQKAQNAKAGISVVTDMAAFGPETKQPDQNATKFVDSAALRALEGDANTAPVGNWDWIKGNNGQSTSSSPQIDQHGLSPDDRPIMIGISVPPSDASSHDQTPNKAKSSGNNPYGGSMKKSGLNFGLHGESQPTSFWSPDTPETVLPFARPRPPSSVYSQAPSSDPPVLTDMPPVPCLPQQYRANNRLISLELGRGADDDDANTPCTLFEEDGTSPRKMVAGKKQQLSPESVDSPSRGWWDHVVTPFAEKRMSFSSRSFHGSRTGPSSLEIRPEAYPEVQAVRPSSVSKPPIVRIPTPRRTPSPDSLAGVSQTSNSRVAQYLSESRRDGKHGIMMTDEETVMDHPPPYSPSKRPENGPIRYRAVFPAGHPLHDQFPPSPNPISPGLAATMTSQGATQMVDLGHSPLRSATPASQAHLPARPIGTYLPPAHVTDALGPQNRVERTRRRHEKEDMVARRVGGCWRGRGCIPAGGCYGRTGREGRKKRRICCGIWSTIIALLILIIVLSVVLTRPHGKHEMPSIWVNLTDFPPMPTGVLTVAGGDNIAAKSVCTEPTTLWSCSLPKDDQKSVEPYKPNQPTVIMQIQWDNSTRQSWKVPNGDAPVSVSKRTTGFVASARALIQARASSDFEPNPSAPKFSDMWFMGETTDGIVSNEKAGEPAPFYISILKSMDDTVESPSLQRRDGGTTVGNVSLADILPRPDLTADGTPAPAVMLPNPVQQPVRLYDRGLDTEHYGFYTHFRRTIFLKSVTANSTEDTNVPLDEDGGCRKSEAGFLATWGETRMLVRIWTRKLATNTSRLVQPDGSAGIGGVAALRRPGTMPWPVTITLDTHGGNPKKKLVWETPMDDRQRLTMDRTKLLVNKMGEGGTWINPRGTGNAKYGGFDGGTGGCKCEWVNWV